jgi:hypothetical protein
MVNSYCTACFIFFLFATMPLLLLSLSTFLVAVGKKWTQNYDKYCKLDYHLPGFNLILDTAYSTTCNMHFLVRQHSFTA